MIKPIPEYEGYFVDSSGNVFSKWINKGRHGKVIGQKLRKIKGSKTKRGHVYVRFGRESKALYIHRLVYRVFVGEIPEGLLIRHLNDIPYDNRVENLAIGTQKDNMRDCIKNGHHKNNRKFEECQVNEIKRLSKFVPIKELAARFGVNEKTIRNVINNYYKKENVS